MQSGLIVAGKYRLNQLLGSGGMADVWSATNTFTERQIAIKFMNMQVGKTPEAAARFLKEAKVSARVNHPNIIDIIDVGQTDEGQLFLVMELLTGFPLEVAIRRQTPPMTLYEFAIVMIEVGGALEAAHKAGVVHRDLKPTNIFLHKVREGLAIPKLLDFGVSKFLEDDQNHALTIAGTVLGSPLYMSPEQARGDSHLDGRTDVFAFGAILFEALCGYRAYEAKNFNALIVKIATTKPKRIDECAPNVPESLKKVVRACLECDLKKRVASFEEVNAMLRAALPELQASSARLPVPVVASSVVDPDATNALPVLRGSDHRLPEATAAGADATGPARPGSIPPPAPGFSQMGSGTYPPGAVPIPQNIADSGAPTGPSWHTPNTSYASISAGPPPRKNHAAMIAVVGLVGFVGVAIGAGIALTSKAPAAQTVVAQATTPTPPPPATTTAAASAEPPSISVDSLPGATPGAEKEKKLGPVPRGNGRLFVTAHSGWCQLTVDGKDRGPTPIAGLDLPVGNHHLECRSPNGKTKSANIGVQDGATARYKFALDD